MSLLTSWFWPKVSDRKNAQFAISEAFVVSLVLACITAIVTAIDFLRDTGDKPGPEGFVDASVFAVIAFGIYRRSRVAAVAGFALYLVGRIYVMATNGPSGLVISVLVALAFLHGVRGTFAYQKLPPRPAGLPSLAESFQAFQQDTSATENNPSQNDKEGTSGTQSSGSR